jgi:hypothetical protein
VPPCSNAQPSTPQPVPDLYYDQPTATGNNGSSAGFIAQWKGTFNSDAAGTFRFSVDHADGAILVIDPGTDHAQVALYALSLPGDTDMDGSTTVYDQIAIFGSGYYNDGRTDHTWTDGDLNGDGVVNFLDVSQVMGYESSAVVSARTITANTNDMVDSGYLTDGVNLTAGSRTFELDVFQRGGESNTFAQLSVSNPDTPTTFYSVDSKAPVVTAEPITAIAGQEFDGVVATFTPATHRTTAEDYAPEINWGDGSATEAAEAFDIGDGTFGVWASHTFASAGAYTPHIKVTHIASTLQGETNGSATVADSAPPVTPTAPGKPTGLTAQAISTSAIGLIWDHVPDATSFTVTRTGPDGTYTFPVTDPLANSYVDDNAVIYTLKPHTSYTYTVKATNDVGDSSASDAVTISTLNTPPVAFDDPFESTAHDQPLDISRDLHWFDADHDQVSLDESSLSAPQHGTVSVVTDPQTGAKTIRYQPAPGFVGNDSFTFTVSDGIDHSQPGTVDIRVTHVPPVAASLVGTAVFTADPSGTTASASFYLGGSGETGARFILVDAPPNVSLVDDHTGLVTVTQPYPSEGDYPPVQFTYKMNDGLSDSNLASARINFPSDYHSDWPNPGYGWPNRVQLPQGTSDITDVLDPTGAAVEIIEGPHGGTFSRNSDDSYTYAPAPSFTGTDWVTYRLADGGTTDPNAPWTNSSYMTIFFDVSPALATLQADRAGLNYGEPIGEAVKRGGDPAKYVILTNNGDLENHADGTADNADDTAQVITATQLNQLYNPYVPSPTFSIPEPDLAPLNVSVRSSNVSPTRGTVELKLSDPSAVRILASNPYSTTAHEIYAPGKNEEQNLFEDLSNLAASPLDSGLLWMEGLKPCPDLKMSLIFRNEAGQEVTRDELHVTIGEVTTVGKDGQPVTEVTDLDRNEIFDNTEGVSGIDPLPDQAYFKIVLNGLPKASVLVQSSSNAADSYSQEDTQSSSTEWGVVYDGDASNVIIPSDKAAIYQALGIHAVHNDSAPTTTITTQPAVPGGPAFDAFTRKAALPKRRVADAALTVSATTTTSVSLSWTTSPPFYGPLPTAFDVQQLGADGVTWSTVATVPGTTSTLTVSGLSPATVYSYRLISKFGNVNWPKPVEGRPARAMTSQRPGNNDDLNKWRVFDLLHDEELRHVEALYYQPAGVDQLFNVLMAAVNQLTGVVIDNNLPKADLAQFKSGTMKMNWNASPMTVTHEMVHCADWWKGWSSTIQSKEALAYAVEWMLEAAHHTSGGGGDLVTLQTRRIANVAAAKTIWAGAWGNFQYYIGKDCSYNTVANIKLTAKMEAADFDRAMTITGLKFSESVLTYPFEDSLRQRLGFDMGALGSQHLGPPATQLDLVFQ